MTLKRGLLIITLVLTLRVPGPVKAQAAVALQSLRVSLWPEYDRPEMLLIYHVSLAQEVSLPVEVSFRIPAEAGEPNAVAERDVDGRLYNVAYEREVRGDWAVITYIATVPESQLEYYDPGLIKDGESRHYEYQWPGDYPVAALSVQVQQPAGAEAVQISPEMGAAIQGTDGLDYYEVEIGGFAQGESFDLTLDYQKSSDALSVELIEMLQIQPSEPITTDTVGRVELLGVMPWLVAGLGLVLIVISVVWFWRSARKATQPRPAKRGRRRVSSPEFEDVASEAGIYCHQCGKRAEPGDRFCRACGTKLRT